MTTTEPDPVLVTTRAQQVAVELTACRRGPGHHTTYSGVNIPGHHLTFTVFHKSTVTWPGMDEGGMPLVSTRCSCGNWPQDNGLDRLLPIPRSAAWAATHLREHGEPNLADILDAVPFLIALTHTG